MVLHGHFTKYRGSRGKENLSLVLKMFLSEALDSHAGENSNIKVPVGLRMEVQS